MKKNSNFEAFPDHPVPKIDSKKVDWVEKLKIETQNPADLLPFGPKFELKSFHFALTAVLCWEARGGLTIFFKIDPQTEFSQNKHLPYSVEETRAITIRTRSPRSVDGKRQLTEI